jgi:hypothetical protein
MFDPELDNFKSEIDLCVRIAAGMGYVRLSI